MLGFMLPTWFLSMWISNTATTAMMIPVAESVLQQFKISMRSKRVVEDGSEIIDCKQMPEDNGEKTYNTHTIKYELLPFASVLTKLN